MADPAMQALRDEDRMLADIVEGMDARQEVDFKEYGEDIADGIQVCKCATCGHEHAAKKD